jgi:hypothetical protein
MVDADRFPAEVQGDIQLGQLAVVEHCPFLRPLPGENLLGQRGPVVGLVWFVANESNATGKPLHSQKLHGTQAAQPGTYDHHVHHAPSRRGLMVSGLGPPYRSGDLVHTSAYEQLALPRPQFPALFLSQATPDAVGLACGQCMAAALLQNGAALADFFGVVGAARSR